MLASLVLGVLTAIQSGQVAANGSTPWLGMGERTPSTPRCPGSRCWPSRCHAWPARHIPTDVLPGG